MRFDEQKLIINSPDLVFVKYCEETFGLNKGVYNTIDQWLYRKGFLDIKDRRKKTMEFLLFCTNITNKGKRKLKFGRGNLTNLLLEFTVRPR